MGEGEGRGNPDSHARKSGRGAALGFLAGGGRSGEYLVEFESGMWEGAADAAVE